MSKPSDFFGASPKTVLDKPYMHVQEQRAYNEDGGSTVADAWTRRVLNTTIYNDILGASLNNVTGEVSIPVGKYYTKGLAVFVMAANSTVILGIGVDGSITLQSLTQPRSPSTSYALISVSGLISITQPGKIDLSYYAGLAMATSGLGFSNSSGSITDAAIPSIYSELEIWQLSGSVEVA